MIHMKKWLRGIQPFARKIVWISWIQESHLKGDWKPMPSAEHDILIENYETTDYKLTILIFLKPNVSENCNFITTLSQLSKSILLWKRHELEKIGKILWTERNRRENRNWTRYESSMTLILAAVHLILSIFSHQIKIWWDNDLIITVGYR